MRELRQQRPPFIVDMNPGSHYVYGKYPPEQYPRLWQLMTTEYVLDKTFATPTGAPVFRLFRRRAGARP